MKLFKKIRKGFTLIELVVVIAVIAILSAVAVVSYILVTNRAKESSDHALIDQINTSLKASSILNKKHTVYDVLEDLKEDSGFGVEKLKPELKDAEFVYSYSMDKFAYWKDNKVVYPADVAKNSEATGVDLWFFKAVESETAEATLEAGKSFYIKSISSNVTTLNVKGGVDLGAQIVEQVKYTNTGSAQNVVIRTNSYSTVLTIDAENDTVTHYGKAKNIDVDAVDNNNCYNEHGDVLGNINLKQGKVVVHEGCKAAAVVIDMTAAELASVTTLSADNSREPTVPIILNTSQVLWNANPNNDLINPTTNNIIYTTLGGTLPDNFENMTKEEKEVAIAAVDDVILGEAAIGSTSYETLAQAFSAVKTNETIVMLKDVTVSGDWLLVNNKNVTLDLSQHTLTSSLSYGFYVYSGSPKFTLKNGIINSTECIVYAKHNAEVFLDNVDITTTNDSSIYAHGSSVITVGSNAIVRNSTTRSNAATYIDENATINVYGKMIRTAGSGGGFAISGNGTDGHLQNTTINIYDGAYIEASDTVAIYNPQRGTINVYGGKIEAYYSCIGIKSGSLNIFGGELKSTWNGEIESGSVPSSSSSGIDTNGSCIQIDSNTSYAGQMNVNITGGNFISEYAYIICETGNVNGSNVVSVRISNATATSHFENLILSTVASENLTNDASWTIVSVSE